MPYYIHKSKYVFIILFVILLLIAVVAPFVLPDRFFSDAYTIVLDKYNEIGYIGSYPLSMLFYKKTGLGALPFPVVALVQFPILFYILYKIGIPRDFHLATVKNIVMYLAMLMIAAFISMPSKEFITFVYVSLIVFMFQSPRFSFKMALGLSIFLLLLFGAIFRPYFAMIPIIAGGMYLFTFIRLKNKTVSTIGYGILVAIFLSLAHGLVKGQYFSESTREELNIVRLFAKDSNSLILSPIPTDTWYGEIIGIIYGFFSVNLPLNGLKHILSPQIVAFIIWQLLLFWILLVRLSRCLKDKAQYKKELWVILFIFAYFILQGVFEPDLGSAVRHKIGMLPLIYYALYYEDFRKKLSPAV